MTAAVPPIARVVVRPPNWLGDAVLALPALAAVRAHFASADVTIAAPQSIAPLFREQIAARPDHVIDLPTSRQDVAPTLATHAFDLGILFPNSFRSAWQFRRAGITERWGYPTAGRRWLLPRASTRARPRPIHQADYYRALVRGLGLACGDDPPTLSPSSASRKAADALLASRNVSGRRLVAVAPGAAYGQAKQWPPERMAAIIARLLRDDDVEVVLVGAGHDRDAARAIESWLRRDAPAVLARVVDLVGQTSLGTLTGVLARTVGLVTNDSGAMHLAAALGRPVVALFGPTDERATGPLGVAEVVTAPAFCRPCLLRTCPIDHRCMTRITVDTVEAAIRRRISETPA